MWTSLKNIKDNNLEMRHVNSIISSWYTFQILFYLVCGINLLPSEFAIFPFCVSLFLMMNLAICYKWTTLGLIINAILHICIVCLVIGLFNVFFLAITFFTIIVIWVIVSFFKSNKEKRYMIISYGMALFMILFNVLSCYLYDGFNMYDIFFILLSIITAINAIIPSLYLWYESVK